MEILLIIVYLLIPILVLAWILGWRREMREGLSDVQARLDRIENHLLQGRDKPAE